MNNGFKQSEMSNKNGKKSDENSMLPDIVPNELTEDILRPDNNLISLRPLCIIHLQPQRLHDTIKNWK